MGITSSFDTQSTAGVDRWHYQTLEQKQVYSYAHEAFELMHKYAVPPDPFSYAVWFAYVSNSSGALVERIDRHIETTGKISSTELIEI